MMSESCICLFWIISLRLEPILTENTVKMWLSTGMPPGLHWHGISFTSPIPISLRIPGPPAYDMEMILFFFFEIYSFLRDTESKGNQPWILIGRIDAKAEVLILWPPDENSGQLGKDPAAGKDRRQEKGMAEKEMVGWHYQFNGHELGQTLGDGEGQGSLACCSPWGRKVGHDD